MKSTHSMSYESYIKNLLSGHSLNLGCNVFKIGDVNVDIDKGVVPDLIFDLEKMNFPFKGEAFDSVLMHHSLEHLKDPGSALSECRRLLRKGGRIVVVVPSPRNKNYKMEGHKTFFTKKSLVGLISEFFSHVKIFGYRGDTRDYHPIMGKIIGSVLPNQYICIGEKK